MTTLKKIFLLAISFSVHFSCSTDPIEIRPDPVVPVVTPIEGTDPDPEVDPVEKPTTPTPPPTTPPEEPTTEVCNDFDWTNVVDGKITLTCIVDLDGKSITIPSGVTVVYMGGDVKNGTLIFDGGNTIDGLLLNSTLKLEGNYKLSSPIFEFVPCKWDVKEGRVNNTEARKNRDNFENTMSRIKGLGATEFHIDTMDAYFNVDEPQANILPSIAAINIPGDFVLKMTNNTHLRMQPNGSKRPTLLAVFNVDNVTVDGGVLHGDRDEHDYSDGKTHEWGHAFRVSGSKEITIKNMTFMDATGDGIDIHAHGHTWDPHYNRSQNVTIENNKFYRSRRNHISITDGHFIYINNNEFIDASIHTSKSRGVAPGFAIDVEAVRGTDPRGPSEVAQDIFITNNTERGGRLGAITVHTGDKVTIENNKFENSISYSTSIGTIIRNNSITGVIPKQVDNGIAIVAGRDDRYDRNYGNKVIGNKVTNYAIGLVLNNKELEVYGNNLKNCKTGISVGTLRDGKIYDNVVISSRKSSDGIVSHPTSEYMDNVIIGSNTANDNNFINVKRTPIKFTNVNIEPGQESYKLIIKNLTMRSAQTSTINNSHGIEFTGNIITQGGIRLVDLKNSVLKSNQISTTTSHGIRLDKGCKNLKIDNHNISVSDKFECITQTTTDGVGINVTSLRCNGEAPSTF